MQLLGYPVLCNYLIHNLQVPSTSNLKTYCDYRKQTKVLENAKMINMKTNEL